MTRGPDGPAAAGEDHTVAWPISEVARMAHVSARTLRYWDEVGLLHPASVAANGYRWYERDDLLRLQRILLLRDLGLRLDVVAAVLDGEVDQVEALRGHRELLVAEGRRLARQLATVDRTLQELTGGPEVSDLFEGFEERRAGLERELVERHGEGVHEHFATARERTADWDGDDWSRARRQMAELDARMCAVLRSGATPASDAASAVLADHHAAVSEHWTPDAAQYAGLGQLYVDHPEFRARYDAIDPGLAEFYRDAMSAWAERHLA